MLSLAMLIELVAALASTITLRFLRVGGMGQPLPGFNAYVRRDVARSGDAPGMTKLIDGSQRKGWIAGAYNAAVLLSPLLLLGRERYRCTPESGRAYLNSRCSRQHIRRRLLRGF